MRMFNIEEALNELIQSYKPILSTVASWLILKAYDHIKNSNCSYSYLQWYVTDYQIMLARVFDKPLWHSIGLVKTLNDPP